MSSSQIPEASSSDLLSLKKKKGPLTLTPNSKAPDSILMAPTPERPRQPAPPRARNRNMVLSIADIRRAAAKRVGEQKEEVGSARRQIAWLESPKKKKEKKKKLPEKYELLGEFFDSLDSSIRLLKAKNVKPSFRNICPAVEDLTDRRFTYSHLAQLKYVLPEAIEIKKELVLDERSGCLNPDLRVALNVRALENDGKSGEGGIGELKKTLNLRMVFRDRLLEISRSQPEDYEIPEEPLPHPFNRRKEDIHSSGVKFSSSSASPVEESTGSIQGSEIAEERDEKSSNQSTVDLNFNIIKPSCELRINQQPGMGSHLSGSVRRHFSRKGKSSEPETIQDDLSKASLQASDLSIKEDSIATSSHGLLLDAVCSDKHDSVALSCHGQVPETPTKMIDSLEDDGLSANNAVIQTAPGKLASTPKLVSTPARLMSSTPAPNPPKRCFMSPEDSSPNKLVRRPPRSRSLKFDTPVKSRNAEEEVLDIDDASIDKDILDILPEDLLQSLREKERKVIEERTPAITQAKRRQKMITKLPKLFNMIHFLFQSMNRSYIAKQELVHKIIWNHSDMIDREDVDEILNLLLELVPDWISEKKLGGDLLVICINKGSSPEAIRSRLEDAI